MADERVMATGSGSELAELAIKTVDELVSRLGVDGAIVIVVRKAGPIMGAASRSSAFGTEDMFAIGIKSMLDVRDLSIKKDREAIEKGKE